MISQERTDDPGSLITADGPVVVGFDGSRSAWSALRWAADEAGRRHATLEVVGCAGEPFAVTERTAAPGGAHLNRARRHVDDAARVAASRGLQIQVLASVADGAPHEALVERSRRAALLVLGRHDPESTTRGGSR